MNAAQCQYHLNSKLWTRKRKWNALKPEASFPIVALHYFPVTKKWGNCCPFYPLFTNIEFEIVFRIFSFVISSTDRYTHTILRQKITKFYIISPAPSSAPHPNKKRTNGIFQSINFLFFLVVWLGESRGCCMSRRIQHKEQPISSKFFSSFLGSVCSSFIKRMSSSTNRKSLFLVYIICGQLHPLILIVSII